MRTKTLLLSALLGALGSVSVHAQNVYSLNAVGYINVTLEPGWTILTCPLQCTDTNGTPDNSIANLLNNAGGAYQSSSGKAEIYAFSGGTYSASDTAGKANLPSGWQSGGTIQLTPGAAVFFFNPNPIGTGANMTATFVGTVPTGGTNALIPGYNLVGSIVPVSGDLVTNTLSALTNFPNKNDYIYTFDSDAGGPGVQVGYGAQNVFHPSQNPQWSAGDVTITNVYNGFFYWNNQGTTNSGWVENFSVAQ